MSAFQNLVDSGADCSGGNGLSSLMKNFGQDRSLQQDRFEAGYGETSGRKAFNRPNVSNSMEHNFTEEFLQEGGQPMETFNFTGLNRELDNIHMQPPPQVNSDWANDFMRHGKGVEAQGPNFHDFKEFEEAFQHAAPLADQHHWESEFEKYEGPSLPHDTQEFDKAYETAKQEAAWESEFMDQESWAKEFQEEENISDPKEALAKTAGALLESIDASNPKFQNSTFLGLMRKLRDQEATVEGNKIVEQKVPAEGGSTWATEFEDRIDSYLNRQSDAGMSIGEAAKLERSWAEEFGESSNATFSQPLPKQDWTKEFERTQADWDEVQDQEFGEMEEAFRNADQLESWSEEYKNHLGTAPQDSEWEAMEEQWNTAKDTASSLDGEYRFTANNPYLENPSLLDANIDLNSDLNNAILVLEAKVQLDPQDGQSWYLLGTKQQENEQDGMAIASLKRAIDIDPKILDAWMGLSVSYTNEGYKSYAYDALESWIRNHDRYSNLCHPSSSSQYDRQAAVMEMYLEAVRANAEQEFDPDVQVGLGVLLNIAEEYEKAVDCFQTALAYKPEDYLLWNKLGATLANSHDPSKAIDAYFHALEINPNYIRARYNLAVSCINLGQHKEAAEHLLQALALQSGDGSTINSMMSDNIWDTLRMAMDWIERPDLIAACDRRDMNAFRTDFAF
ncbi:TPR-like protein [Basidiobolus meristosporus CBS 931.73]|uniref:TPR-like protein n=1 Tax=Basidiobolus meristosporus CBS 931.73 TaxID=1314790 RepID=A0A1Y1X2M3_9FUNG|nr:TPR-like protein [Basidiobolus meristosporus CBS 931.73]|eukprot:ORX80047.1 TPR-like protein [Basidiobolus meristosporus CBS 931.73]